MPSQLKCWWVLLAVTPIDHNSLTLHAQVIARHASTIRAAKAAGALTCHFMKSDSEIPNHSADFQLTNLAEVQYIVEDFNGISYRGRVP